MSNKTKYEKVKEFHQAFNYPMPEQPTPMSEEMVLNRAGFLVEEIIELIHATAGDHHNFLEMYDEFIERANESYRKQAAKSFPENVLVAQADAIVDIEYFNNGNATLIAVNPDPLFNDVHDCNMNKLFPDGKPRYNEHGKIIKPEGWVAPEPLLEAEIQRQIEAAQK